MSRNTRLIPVLGKLPPTVLILGLVSFFSDISTEMIYPLLPRFLVQELNAPVSVLGLIEGVAAGIVSILTIWSGWRSDRIGSRIGFIRFGYSLPFFGKLIIALSQGWLGVFFGRLIDRVGKGIRSSPRDALIADSTEAAVRGRAFGFHRMMDSSGAALGVLFAGLILWYQGDSNFGQSVRIVFGVAVFFAFVSALTTLSIPSTPPIIQPCAENRPPPWQSIGSLGSGYWRCLIVFSVFSFANSSDTFLLLRFNDLSESSLAVVIGYGVYQLVHTLVSLPAGSLSDRIGRWPMIRIGWALYGIVYILFSLDLTPMVAWFLLSMYGIYIAFTESVTKVLITEHVDVSKRGTALGMFYFILGICAFTSNTLTGILWDVCGQEVPFLVGGILAFLALLLSFVLIVPVKPIVPLNQMAVDPLAVTNK